MSFLHTVVLSVDSLAAGCALAPLLPRTSQRLAAAALVGTADAAASLLGSLISPAPTGLSVAAPAALALYGISLIAVTSVAGGGRRAANPPGASCARVAGGPTGIVLVALAAALSVDNLLSPGVAANVVAVAACSGGLMLAGLAAGGRLRRGRSSGSPSAWLGAGLVATAWLAVLS